MRLGCPRVRRPAPGGGRGGVRAAPERPGQRDDRLPRGAERGAVPGRGADRGGSRPRQPGSGLTTVRPTGQRPDRFALGHRRCGPAPPPRGGEGDQSVRTVVGARSPVLGVVVALGLYGCSSRRRRRPTDERHRPEEPASRLRARSSSPTSAPSVRAADLADVGTGTRQGRRHPPADRGRGPSVRRRRPPRDEGARGSRPHRRGGDPGRTGSAFVTSAQRMIDRGSRRAHRRPDRPRVRGGGREVRRPGGGRRDRLRPPRPWGARPVTTCPSTPSPIGRLQAQTLIDCLAQQGVTDPRVIILDGGTDVDDGAVLMDKGVHEVLDPLVAAGRATIEEEATVKGWRAVNAAPTFRVALDAAGGQVDGVLAASDGIADAVIGVLAQDGLDGAGGRRRSGLGDPGASPHRDRPAEHDDVRGPSRRGRRRRPAGSGTRRRPEPVGRRPQPGPVRRPPVAGSHRRRRCCCRLR